MHTGDRVLAEFLDAPSALQAALAIQASTEETGITRANEPDPLFRIGLHIGEVVTDGERYLGEAINVAIGLTVLADAGGVLVSGLVRDGIEDSANIDLPFLGNHELKNVSGVISVYSARAIPKLRSLYLRLDALFPRKYRPVYFPVALFVLVTIAWMSVHRTRWGVNANGHRAANKAVPAFYRALPSAYCAYLWPSSSSHLK